MLVVVTIIILIVVGFGFMPIFWFMRVRWVGCLMCDSVFFLCVLYVLCGVMYAFGECWGGLYVSCLSVELESFPSADWKRGGRFYCPAIWKKWEYPSRQGRC